MLPDTKFRNAYNLYKTIRNRVRRKLYDTRRHFVSCIYLFPGNLNCLYISEEGARAWTATLGYCDDDFASWG